MPVQKGEKKTDAQRKAENKYKAGKYKVAACQLPIAKYELFREYAKKRGKTVSGALLAYIDSCISAAGKDPGADPVE